MKALVPVAELESLGRAPGVGRVEAPQRFHVAAVTGEGVAAANADVFHLDGLRGAGVKIGIFDAGFGQYGLRQVAGELPSGSALKTLNYCHDFEGHIHGTGVAEIVHDLAPEAELHLICIEDAVDMAAATDYAIANGIQIVNQSGGFINTSRGDGSGGPDTPDGIVARARAAGILWVASAGNSAKYHWSGSFVDADGDGVGEFAGGDETNDFSTRAGEQVCAYLKWDAWPTTAIDYDLMLTTPAGAILGGSFSAQTGSQEPLEGFCFPSSTESTYALAIRGPPGSRAAPLRHLRGRVGARHAAAPGGRRQPDRAGVRAAGARRRRGLLGVGRSGVVQLAGPHDRRRDEARHRGLRQRHLRHLRRLLDLREVRLRRHLRVRRRTSRPRRRFSSSSIPGSARPSCRRRWRPAAADLGAPGKDNVYGAGRLRLPVRPTPTTSFPSSVGRRTAVLAGTVKPASLGGPSVLRVLDRRQLRARLRRRRRCRSLPPPATLPVAVQVDGLEPTTSYHARLVVENEHGVRRATPVGFTTTSASAPTLSTSPPTNRGQTGVTLNGFVNANNAATSYSFEYGPSPSLGLATPAGSLGGDTTAAVSAALTGLSPGTVYYYRLSGSNSFGSAQSALGSFATLPNAPPVVATGAASAVGSSSATVSATVDPRGNPTTYAFEYGTSPALGASTAAAVLAAGDSPQAVSTTLTGLAPTTTYYYRVVATNSAGGPVAGAVASVHDRGCAAPAAAASTRGAATTGSAAPPSSPRRSCRPR